MVHVRDQGCAGVELACSDDAVGLSSLVQVYVGAGETIAIIADAYSGGGAYQLNIAAAD